jgi:APA family basic amino acid/polyamine antiporter
MFGALSVAELGAIMPKAGGQYVYLREAYSPLWGFLYGWSAFAVINTASIAAVAVTFATYLGYFFPLDPFAIKIVASMSIVLLTVINCFGITLGAMVQNIFTLSKMGALLALVILSFALSGGSVSNFSPLLPSIPLPALAGPFVLALVAALWSYDGWIEITYVAGEIKEPPHNLPRSLFLSTSIVILFYVIINFAMMYVLSMNEMSNSPMVASDAAVKILGNAGAAFISVAVIISTFGTNNGFIFTCPRIYYAMANEGLFFRWLAGIHPRYQTPIPSLIVQAILSCFLIYTGSFDQLYTYVVFASWIFYAMSAVAVIVLRKRSPQVSRPYKTWGYPFTPIVFALFAFYLVVYTIIEDPRDAFIGAGIIALGIPAYAYWKGKHKHFIQS